jgi:predicted ATPase/class 3 adenylate cyclase/DNA-binding CsgD family transcriptional regulator
MVPGRDGVLPSGTVTLLLADVEGSTRMWQRDSAGAGSAMFELDVLTDELIAKFDGARPLEQGEGDSFVAAFGRAADGLACAVELQKRLVDGCVRLRIALHTGDIALRDDKRYDGPTIIRAARVRDLGHGGQTLVTSTTHDLVIDAMPDRATLIDVGFHELKGLDRPERVWQLTHPDLPSSFPPLRSAEPKTDNLPVPLSSFIGRSAELEQVRELIRNERLVTLTGAGGCGKTRLAIEAIRSIADSFSDGVWFCDLGPLADPTVVAQSLRTTIGLPDSATGDDIGIVVAHLRAASALVVLDNCEHLIDASAEVVQSLLAGCPALHVVTTSREPLGIDGENAWRVPSLDTPAAEAASDLDQVATFDAIRLFVDRAAKARPNFVLDAANASAIVEVCRRLDGIPLAIELAAARVRVLSVRQIVDGLNDRFRLLGRSARTTLERQQTLFASVGWSHDLLTDAQRAALRRASVFAGGFTLEAAEHVLATDGIEGAEVLELVSQLVDRSLLVADERTSGVRYRMLETIRQFARDRLVDSAEAMDVADRHLDFFTAWAEEVFANFDPGAVDLVALTARIVEDYDNIRAACEWAIDHERYEEGLRLASALERFWNQHATAREGAQWLEVFLERTHEAPPHIRLRGLVAISSAKEYFNDLEAALEAAREALPLARACGDDELRLRLLLRLGVTTGLLDPPEGSRYLDEAVDLARATSDDAALAEVLYSFSQVYMFDKRTLAPAREAVQIAAPIGDAVAVRPRFVLGLALWVAGEVDAAEAELTGLKDMFETLGDGWLAAASEAVLGGIASARGDAAEGRILLESGFARCDAMGRDDGKGFVGIWCAQLAIAEGRLDDAQFYADSILPFFGELPGPLGAGCTAAAHATIGVIRCAQGDAAGARGSIAIALATAPRDFIGIFVVPALGSCARVLRVLGETSAAESAALDGLRMAAELGILAVAPNVIDVVAALRADIGADADAARLFAAAESARERMGIVRPHDPIFDTDAEIAALRERLGPQTFDEAWSSGRKLTLEEALEFGLRGRGPRQRPQAGWDALTPTELKVVALVAEGLSNPQIAERLFISRRTVSTHLSHVFLKVGVSSRVELATEATKRG